MFLEQDQRNAYVALDVVDRYYSVNQAAKLITFSAATIHNDLERGYIKSYRETDQQDHRILHSELIKFYSIRPDFRKVPRRYFEASIGFIPPWERDQPTKIVPSDARPSDVMTMMMLVMLKVQTATQNMGERVAQAVDALVNTAIAICNHTYIKGANPS